MMKTLTDEQLSYRALDLHMTAENIRTNLSNIEAMLSISNPNWKNLYTALQEIDSKTDRLADRIRWK